MLKHEQLVQIAQRETSRRRFLTGSAKIAGGSAIALAVAGSPLSAFAFHGDEFRERGAGEPDYTSGDIDVLNYALTLEHLEANFYIQAINNITEFELQQYVRTELGFGNNIVSEVYNRVVDVRNHEIIHVETLIAVIQSLGGTPVPPCEYAFGNTVTEPGPFLATSMVLENTGVMAYDGAIDLIESRAIQTAGATIATVEARHASYFNLINNTNPFPAPFDEAVEPPQIIEAVLATGLIVSCPVAPPIPDEPDGCRP